MNGDSTKAYEGPAALIHDDRTFVVQAEVYRSEAPSPKIVGPLIHIPPPPEWTVEAYPDGHLPGVRLFDPEPMLIRFLDGHEGSMFVTDGCVGNSGGLGIVYDLKTCGLFPTSRRTFGLMTVGRHPVIL